MKPFSSQSALEPASGTALDRRAFIVGTFGISAALVFPAWAADAPTAGDFQQICAALANGRKIGTADAAAYLAALSGRETNGALTALVEVVRTTPTSELDAVIKAKGLDAAANEVVATVYSGVIETGGQVQVITYEDALVWEALPYTKPSGQCGGEFGYWSAPG